MFTMQSTPAEVYAYPDISRELPIYIEPDFLEKLAEPLRSHTFEQLAREIVMPWGGPFPAMDIIRAANLVVEIREKESWEIIPLWPGKRPYVPAPTGGKECVCLFTPKHMDSEVRPAAILCPGGGYTTLAMMGEGFAEADYMADHGYRPFVLHYRVAPNTFPAPQTDLALAILHIRANAAKYGIDPNNILIMGSSAGGHLCASTAALHERLKAQVLSELPEMADAFAPLSARPDKVCLSYAVVAFDRMGGVVDECYQALTGGDPSLVDLMSVQKQVTADYPKTFLWACEDDQMVPYWNSTLMHEALDAAGVANELHIYPTGGHGISTGAGTPAEGWMDKLLAFMA